MLNNVAPVRLGRGQGCAGRARKKRGRMVLVATRSAFRSRECVSWSPHEEPAPRAPATGETDKGIDAVRPTRSMSHLAESLFGKALAKHQPIAVTKALWRGACKAETAVN